MLLDPSQLSTVPPAAILEQIALGQLDIDHRVLHALLDRPQETIPALVAFSQEDVVRESIDLKVDAALLFHALHAPEGIPFLLRTLEETGEDAPEEVVEALHSFGTASLEQALARAEQLPPGERGELPFLLATFHQRDSRILQLLLEQTAHDPEDGAFLLGLYGDPEAERPLLALGEAAGPGDEVLQREVREALVLLKERRDDPATETASFDIYDRYPEEADLPIDLLTEAERLELLSDARPEIRAQAAHSFFNNHPPAAVVKQLLVLAKSDRDETVRSRAWESLVDGTEQAGVVDALLTALRSSDTSPSEKASVLIGLSMETDRNEVRKAMETLYREYPNERAKTLEAMWRSLHPAFRDYFAGHLEDGDVEVRRSAVWGVGYYAVKAALDKLRSLFADGDLRSDAIFAYTLALPNDISKSRVKGLLSRIDKDAGGLSEMEQRLAMTALDERLMLSGKDPYFFPED